jgi:low affinity Fe/Cu permease
LNDLFTRWAAKAADMAGRPVTFVAAVIVLAVWALTGPFLGYSDTWQLIINTGTTIVTFLMVFLIQGAQNRDQAAVQAKLDELIKATDTANDALIDIEHDSEEQLAAVQAAARANKP